MTCVDCVSMGYGGHPGRNNFDDQEYGSKREKGNRNGEEKETMHKERGE